MKHFLLVLTVLAFTSCTKETDDDTEQIGFYYLPRTCEYANTSHYYRIDMGDKIDNDKFKGTYAIEPLNKKSIAIKDYLLSVNVGSFSKEMTSQEGFNPEDYLTEADPYMENQIKQFLNGSSLNSLKTSSQPRLNLVQIEYRKEKLITLNISCLNKIFDEQAGESLNDYIEIFDTPHYHSFLFNQDKQLIGSIKKEWSINEYLNMKPLVSYGIYFRFKSVAPQLPLDTRFVVEMEVEGGKILRDTTENITLLP
ncbi:MAG: hypothetical protein N4A59_11380 [Marinifilum sp.]|jgi:hypothetical protein|nr:hypothetical protein [Marinifilum sp.]